MPSGHERESKNENEQGEESATKWRSIAGVT